MNSQNQISDHERQALGLLALRLHGLAGHYGLFSAAAQRADKSVASLAEALKVKPPAP